MADLSELDQACAPNSIIRREIKRREAQRLTVRHAGYVFHAFGNRIWLTPAHNSETASGTEH